MIFLKENDYKCEPLLFIDSVKEKVEPKNQNIYDSREKPKTTKKIKKHGEDFYIKINRLITMYNRNKKIECKVCLLTKEEYLVVVKEFQNNLLICILIETKDEIVFDIHEIDEITIEKIN